MLLDINFEIFYYNIKYNTFIIELVTGGGYCHIIKGNMGIFHSTWYAFSSLIPEQGIKTTLLVSLWKMVYFASKFSLCCRVDFFPIILACVASGIVY